MRPTKTSHPSSPAVAPYLKISSSIARMARHAKRFSGKRSNRQKIKGFTIRSMDWTARRDLRDTASGARSCDFIPGRSARVFFPRLFSAFVDVPDEPRPRPSHAIVQIARATLPSKYSGQRRRVYMRPECLSLFSPLTGLGRLLAWCAVQMVIKANVAIYVDLDPPIRCRSDLDDDFRQKHPGASFAETTCDGFVNVRSPQAISIPAGSKRSAKIRRLLLQLLTAQFSLPENHAATISYVHRIGRCRDTAAILAAAVGVRLGCLCITRAPRLGLHRFPVHTPFLFFFPRSLTHQAA